MTCRRYIEWSVSHVSSIAGDWVWFAGIMHSINEIWLLSLQGNSAWACECNVALEVGNLLDCWGDRWAFVSRWHCRCVQFVEQWALTWCTNSLIFNNCTFCPHCIYVFCMYLRINSDLCHLHHKQTGFYNREEKCLQRGTDWVFK
jgi:hypothetical protein